MKKKLFLLGALVLLIALLITAALRDPNKAPDIALVAGKKPFSTSAHALNSKIPNRLMRSYSLHMSFDEAVQRLDKELSPKGWSHDVYFNAAHFRSGAGMEWVMIERSMFVPKPGMANVGPASRAPFMDVNPDPHGWVTVTTYRAINSVNGLLFAGRQLISPHGSGFVPYVLVAPLPKVGSPEQKVDVSKGTMDLEGNAQMLYVNDSPP